jgi:hypothetical protein
MPELRLIDGHNEPITASDRETADLTGAVAFLEATLVKRDEQVAELTADLANVQHELLLALREIPKYANRNFDKRKPQVEQVWVYWKKTCKHPNSKLTDDRWATIRGALEHYDVATLCRAVDGAAFDPWVTSQRNGTPERHDDPVDIFKGRNVERYANKAPRVRTTNAAPEGSGAIVPSHGAKKEAPAHNMPPRKGKDGDSVADYARR